jgi:hypothetical protein
VFPCNLTSLSLCCTLHVVAALCVIKFLHFFCLCRYGQSYRELQRHLLHSNTHQDCAINDIDVVNTLTEYRTAVSKFAFAAVYMNDHIETAETLGVRTIAHLLAHTLALQSVASLYLSSLDAVAGQLHGDTVHDESLSRGYIMLALTVLRESWSAVSTAKKEPGTVHVRAVIAAVDALHTTLGPHITHMATAMHSFYANVAQHCQAEKTTQTSAEHSGGSIACETYKSYRAGFENLPELLKLSAELTYELLVVTIDATTTGVGSSIKLSSVSANGDNVELRTEHVFDVVTSEELFTSLDLVLGLLLQLTHPSQRSIVESMQRDVNTLRANVLGRGT